MSEESLQPKPDINQYRPLNWGEVSYIDGLAVPEREFEEKESGRWVSAMTPQGVIVINMIHKDYPDASCQVQCCPDDAGTYYTFMIHWPLIEGDYTRIHIPEKLVEEMFFEAFPQVMSQLEEKGGRLA